MVFRTAFSALLVPSDIYSKEISFSCRENSIVLLDSCQEKSEIFFTL